MTAKELKEKLQNIPDDTIVMIDDCGYGFVDADSAEYAPVQRCVVDIGDYNQWVVRKMGAPGDEREYIGEAFIIY